MRQVMWDGIDGRRCRMKGWIAESWDDPELRFLLDEEIPSMRARVRLRQAGVAPGAN